jgi:hypothetical protein
MLRAVHASLLAVAVREGNTLFVANESGSVGKYDAGTGAAIDPTSSRGSNSFPKDSSSRATSFL